MLYILFKYLCSFVFPESSLSLPCVFLRLPESVRKIVKIVLEFFFNFHNFSLFFCRCFFAIFFFTKNEITTPFPDGI